MELQRCEKGKMAGVLGYRAFPPPTTTGLQDTLVAIFH